MIDIGHLEKGISDYVVQLLLEARTRFHLKNDVLARDDEYFSEFRLGSLEIFYSKRLRKFEINCNSDGYDEAAVYIARKLKIRSFQGLSLNLHNPETATKIEKEQTPEEREFQDAQNQSIELEKKEGGSAQSKESGALFLPNSSNLQTLVVVFLQVSKQADDAICSCECSKNPVANFPNDGICCKV